MGRAGSGKTTVADILDRNYNNRYRPFALAGPLKRMCSELIGRPLTKADRALMIEFGQSMRAVFGSGVWCDMTMRAIEAWWKSDDDNDGVRYPVIVEDGRHAYEYDYFVVQRGFVPVRIVAPDETRFERLLKRDGVDQRDVLAGQETELDGVDVAFTIDNGGTMDELERQVSEMLARINDPSYVVPTFPRMLRIGDKVRLTEEAIQAWTWYEPLRDDLRQTTAVVKDIVDSAYVLVHERSGAWFCTMSKRSNLALVEENGA